MGLTTAARWRLLLTAVLAVLSVIGFMTWNVQSDWAFIMEYRGSRLLAMLLADRFTVIGMGKDFATNVGINYAALMVLGVLMVSLISASVVITAGALPFVGLVVPNLVRALVGDNMRRGIVLVALCGAALMLVADLLGRLLIHPYEVPSANLLAIVGSLVFIVILLRGRRQWA